MSSQASPSHIVPRHQHANTSKAAEQLSHHRCHLGPGAEGENAMRYPSRLLISELGTVGRAYAGVCSVLTRLGHYRIAAFALQCYHAAPSPTTTNGAQYATCKNEKSSIR